MNSFNFKGTLHTLCMQTLHVIDARATSAAPLDVELHSGDRAPHPISKGAPHHPAEETHFGSSYPGSYSFGKNVD